MILQTNEYIEYLNANLKFLHYVYKKSEKSIDFTTFKTIKVEEKVKARNYFLKHDFLIEEYLKKNPSLSVIETTILNGFKHAV